MESSLSFSFSFSSSLVMRYMCLNNVSRITLLFFFFSLPLFVVSFVMIHDVIMDHIFIVLFDHDIQCDRGSHCFCVVLFFLGTIYSYSFFLKTLSFLCLFSYRNKVFEKLTFSLSFSHSLSDRLTFGAVTLVFLVCMSILPTILLLLYV